MLDPAKLMVDDVIIIAKDKDELQRLLNICTKWARLNFLEWKLQKCVIVADPTSVSTGSSFILAGEQVPISTSSRYLGITINPNRFTKNMESELKQKSTASHMATSDHHFFDTDLPGNTLTTLYRTNVRSVLMYGLMITRYIAEMIKLDRVLLKIYLKPLIHHKWALPDKLLDRLCVRLRLPSLEIELGQCMKNWKAKLKSNAKKTQGGRSGNMQKTRYTPSEN